ncbi:MAG: ATP-binding cassette domain-containing protein [Gammaproteobacteria bacterium]
MSTIICRGLSFGYEGAESDVFSRLDLIIDTHWRTALVGRNGRGKTTLLRLLAGALVPDRGEIEANVACRLFTGQPEDTGLTAWQAARNVAGPYTRWEAELERLSAAADMASLERYGELESRYRERGGYGIDSEIERELGLLEVDPGLFDRPFERLSGGEQTRCLLAGLFCRADGFPLIDEPTNHLDLAGRRRLAAYLADKTGFLLVSHDRAFLDACIDHVIALNPDTVETHRASFSVWRDQYRARLDEQARTNALKKKEIRRFEATAEARRAGASARESDKGPHVDKGYIGARAARQMKRALAAERRAAEADRLAVLGPNGCGKTTLLDLIAGSPIPHSGELVRRGHVRISRASQLPRWRSGHLGARLATEGLDEARFRQIMAALGVRGTLLELPLDKLSQGQLKKIELARSLIEPAHLMIWDEPLNYIDVETREQLEGLFAGQGRQPALICVEHDARFVENVATTVIELEPLG